MILTRPIGIDLGTTNSAVAMLDPNERDLVLGRDAQGRTTTPSCVWSDARDEIVVGHLARARVGSTPPPVTSIKRAMGTRITVPLGATERTPTEVSGHILAHLRRQMEAELERRAPEVTYDVARGIVTVPAYFDLPAIEATRNAAALAGLDVTELLHEPTAAAVYYGWKHDLGDGVYLVYDLGGGTFDVSVLRRTAGDFLVLGIAGDNFLGGDDFDRRLAEHLRQLLVADGYDLDLDVAGDAEDRIRFARLMALAEAAKKGLSEREEVVVRSAGDLRDRDGVPVVLETVVTRATLESLIDDLLDRTVASCRQALARAREKGDVGVEDVDHVLLVGGSTYVPAVVERVTRALCRDGGGAGGDTAGGEPRARCVRPIRDEPETAVALGAALRAASAGLGVGAAGSPVRLWFESGSTTRRERTTISGHVEPTGAGDATDLEGGRVSLTGPGDEPLGDADLGPGLRFAFPGVELTPGSVNEFAFTVWSPAGTLVATLGRSITHDAGAGRAVRASLSTAVLPKPIVLEGTDGDRLVRTVLLPEGSTLPTTASFTFSVADRGGHIRLPIYQASRIIKELRAEVGSQAVGTPVDVEISCDEQVHITVRVAVGDREFGGTIEPPPPDEVPSDADVEQVDARFHEALSRLPAHDPEAERLRSAYAEARRDVDEARGTGDHPKLIQRVAELDGLVRAARLAEPLDPPIDEVDGLVAACLDLLPEAIRRNPGLAESSLRADLASAQEQARSAYAARDRRPYADAVQIVAATHRYLSTVTRDEGHDLDQLDVTLQAPLRVEQMREATLGLLVVALMAGRTDLVPRVEDQMQEIESLARQAATRPGDVVDRCHVLGVETRRLLAELSPQDAGLRGDARRPELAGLVRLDAQGVDRDALSRGLFDSRPHPGPQP